ESSAYIIGFNIEIINIKYLVAFKVASKGNVTLELVDGSAEVFGTPLVLHKKYSFSHGARIAVFTWKDAVIELVGETESAYIAGETPMVIYLNTHAALEQLRDHAESGCASQSKDPRGPILMVVGPTDVGKTTLCRILCNYAVRSGRTTTFVDLDIGQGSISIPGTIGALPIEKVADIVEGFDRQYPVVYHFGSVTPSANIVHYDLLVKTLAEEVFKRMNAHAGVKYGGIIINTCGWVKGEGYACIVHAAEQFEVDVVIVLDHERLFIELQRDLPNFVKILHQPKSGGVENRSREMRISARNAAVHKYFYGSRALPYYPHTFELSFDEVSICKVGAQQIPAECLPFGMKIDDLKTRVITVEPSDVLTHHIAAVVNSTKSDQSVLTANVFGFIVITSVDLTRKFYTVLSPQPHPLPSNILLLSDVTFLDDKERV
ncbi:unnamed protein product, partial [Dracunculus medinensis]|uniref:Protein CLP1 homolog n=1 Tax=Dracunculus medinensis TaxID=318479 RepID=A0A0N4UGM9_DRAME